MNSDSVHVPSPAHELQPAPVFASTPKATKRVLEFFTAQISNDPTGKAYLNAIRRFAAWRDARGIGHLGHLTPQERGPRARRRRPRYTLP